MYYFDCANDKAKICYVDSGYLGFSANQDFFTQMKTCEQNVSNVYG